MDSTPERRRPDALNTGAAYVALFLLGAMEGLIGCFQFSHTVGQVPVAALVLCVVVFLTCLLGGLGMGSALGALLPAFGWLLASLVLTMPTAAGSVIVTNTTAGKWYLYGGALAAAAGATTAFVLRARAPSRPR